MAPLWPPVEIGGTRPHLFAAALGRPFPLSPSWQLGARAYGQLGTIKGDITCSAHEVGPAPTPSSIPSSVRSLRTTR